MEDSQTAENSGPSEYDEVFITKNAETIDAFSYHVIPVKMERAYLRGRINVMTQALRVEDGSLPQGLTMQNTYVTGILTSHRPSTLAISVPLMEQSITRMDCVICLSICMYPDLSWELLVSVTLVV